MVEKDDMLIFKLREKRQQQQQTRAAQPARKEQPTSPPIPSAEEPVFVVPTTPESVVDAAMPQIRGDRGKYEAKSREAASGLFCEWHPWRPAYAICYKCHKPYCYEDISEYNGRYYCLEDIDSASSTVPGGSAFEYNRLSLVTAAVFLASIFVYIFFLNNLLIYVSQNALQVGLQNFFQINFVNQINYAYLILIAGLLLTMLEFVAGIMVLAQSRKAYAFGIFIGFLSTAAFSYIYIQNFAYYGILISIMSFVGIITLAYSKRAIAPSESIDSALPSQAPPMSYSSVGSF